MPLDGFRWSCDSDSALCDIPQTNVLGRTGGTHVREVLKVRLTTSPPNRHGRGCGSLWPRRGGVAALCRWRRGRRWCAPPSVCDCRRVPTVRSAPSPCVGGPSRCCRVRRIGESCAPSSARCSVCLCVCDIAPPVCRVP